MSPAHDRIGGRHSVPEIAERQGRLLFGLIDYLVKCGTVAGPDLAAHLQALPDDAFSFELLRDEQSARSAADELHAGGEQATLRIGQMAKLCPETAVLDAGAGHGGPARVLARAFGCRVFALERDLVRLLDGIVRTKMAKLDHLVTFCHGDAYQSKLPAGAFDVVFRQHAVYGSEEEQFLKECRRLLRDGGVIACQGTMRTVPLGKPVKLEDHTPQVYRALLEAVGFGLREIETQESTAELLRSYAEHARDDDATNRRMIRLIEGGKVIGFKLVAEKRA